MRKMFLISMHIDMKKDMLTMVIDRVNVNKAVDLRDTN